MELKSTSRDGLLDYLTAQLGHFFPDGAQAAVRPAIARDLDEALDRLAVCIAAVRMWRPDAFDPLHSEQNATFLYYLANTIWRNRGDEGVCTKLFYLNKALNGFHCFYDNELPDRFLIGHSLGIVLVRAVYPRYFVVYQNCTVGKSHGVGPTFEEGVVLYAGSAVMGGCRVRARSYIAPGVVLANRDTPGNCLVFANGPEPVFKPPKRDILADYFRL